jgi:hypothetical protein
MSAQLSADDEDEAMVQWFKNSYECSECGKTWTDEWSCECDDRCPECNTETVPTSSIDLSRPLTSEDYTGAARLFLQSSGEVPVPITDEDAKAYAEAILEGGEHRFSPPRWDRVARKQ